MGSDTSDTSGVRRGMVGGRHLPLAIAVGLALAAVVLGSLLWRREAFVAVIALLAAVAVVEVGRVLGSAGSPVSVPVLLGTVVVAMGGAHLAGPRGLVLGVVVLLVGAVLVFLFDPDRQGALSRLGVTVALGLWVPVLAAHAVLLVDREHGRVLVLAVIGSAALADIGGYAVGVPFGRHRLAPRISPNKTWEGLAGGLLVAAALMAVAFPLASDVLGPGRAAVLALACGAAGFVGDLAESRLKRDLGVKDLGAVLPGHGGVLDRVDSILFALPVGFYLLPVLL